MCAGEHVDVGWQPADVTPAQDVPQCSAEAGRGVL